MMTWTDLLLVLFSCSKSQLKLQKILPYYSDLKELPHFTEASSTIANGVACSGHRQGCDPQKFINRDTCSNYSKKGFECHKAFCENFQCGPKVNMNTQLAFMALTAVLVTVKGRLHLTGIAEERKISNTSLGQMRRKRVKQHIIFNILKAVFWHSRHGFHFITVYQKLK